MGCRVGTLEGCADGWPVGLVGLDEGCIEGCPEGRPTGCLVGCLVG